eukprot:3343545-Lingulodinium_polyedra.AAC.1
MSTTPAPQVKPVDAAEHRSNPVRVEPASRTAQLNFGPAHGLEADPMQQVPAPRPFVHRLAC